MQDINRVLRAAARRLWVAGVIQSVVGTLSLVLVLAILLRVAQQLFALTVPWGDVMLWGAVGAGVAAVIWATIFRAKPDAVARRVDEGADLKESISTALCVAGEDNGNPEVLDYTAANAGTYFIMVEGFGSAAGTFDLTVSISPPVQAGQGDVCQSAVPVPMGGGSFQSTTVTCSVFNPGTLDDTRWIIPLTCTWLNHLPGRRFKTMLEKEEMS